MSIQGAIESWNSLHLQLGLSRSLTSTKASSIHVEVGRVEPKPARQVLGRDVVLPRVLARHAAHRARAARVQRAQLLLQRLGQAPALAPEEEDGQHDALVRCRLGGGGDGGGGEDALAQCAKRLPCRLHARRDGEGVVAAAPVFYIYRDYPGILIVLISFWSGVG